MTASNRRLFFAQEKGSSQSPKDKSNKGQMQLLTSKDILLDALLALTTDFHESAEALTSKELLYKLLVFLRCKEQK